MLQEEDGNASFFYETKVFNTTINKIIKVIEKNNFEDCSNQTLTFDGFQTSNIINFFSKELLEDILPINDFVNYLFHLHYIEYKKGGWQEKHNHELTEKFSFILYLNDSDGNTVFEKPIERSIEPKKGKLVVFDSRIVHYAKRSFKNKKILVGAIGKK